MTETLTLALVGHLVGDYLLQNDWMALNKKKSSFPCLVHAFIWTLAVAAFTGWWSWLPLTFLFVTHFFQDRTTVVFWWMTRVNRQEAFATGPCAPWSIIVVDNTWHVVQLWFAWRFLA